jgi:hypothetical protein
MVRTCDACRRETLKPIATNTLDDKKENKRCSRLHSTGFETPCPMLDARLS